MWNSKHSGFTLLEVMVAVSIIAIVMTAVYRLYAQTISMNNVARFYTTAPLLAQSKFAEISITLSSDKLSDSGDFGEDFPGYNWHISAEDMESEVLGDAAENLKQINMSVALNDDEFIYTFRTYRLVPDAK